ncbi:MAG: nicotinate-nucleotide adenylyltransferase [Eubacteriales bacterium]|nr:nicotinate-nucleotide adenylyltransferase [Eubacteriales bacterium]
MRLGVFGGTFSPPHNGHVGAAMRFVVDFKLDKLLIIPTYIPPHKLLSGDASPEQRYEMCKIAFSDIPNAEVSDIEIRRKGLSYTSDTLSELKNNENEIFLLVGTDMFLTLDSWHEPNKIFALSNIIYIRRENDKTMAERIEEKRIQYIRQFNARIFSLDTSILEISSSEVREQIRYSHESSFLPDKVMNYINERGLYR